MAAALASSSRHKATKHIVLGVYLLITVAIPFIVAATTNHVPIFDLGFNPYALLSLVDVILNFILFATVFRLKLQSEETTWLLYFMGALTLYAIGETFQRLSLRPDAAVFWTTFGGMGAEILPAAIFLFALAYTKPSSRHTGTVTFLLLALGIMTFAQVDKVGLLFSMAPSATKHYPWGYDNDLGNAYFAQILWFLGLFSAAFARLALFRRHTINSVLNRQAAYYMVAIGIPVVGGTITDLILPAIGITSVPPLATFFSVVAAVMLTYGMTRYQTLRVSPSLLAHSILSTMYESVIVVDDTMQVQYMNDQAERVFGVADRNARRSLPDLFNGKYAAEFQEVIDSLQTKPSELIENMERTDGEGKLLYLRAQITRLSEQALSGGYLLTISDVTELQTSYIALAQTEKKLEEEKHAVDQKVLVRTHELSQERARLEASINSLNVGYLMINTDNQLQLINGTARDILFEEQRTSKPGRITLDDIIDILHDTCHLRDLIDECLRTQKPMVVKGAEFNTKILQLFMAPITNINQDKAEQLGVVVLIEDITEAKVQERSRDEFFSIASHELRTPLTAIRGNTSMMQQYYADALKDPDLAHMVQDIHDSSTRLIDIVSDFLDVSSIEQHKINLKLEAFDINEIIENVMYELGALSKEKKLSVTAPKTLHDLPQVLADKNRIKQVLYNLTGNAIKFTEKGTIVIDASVEKTMLKVTVTDSGRGIAKDMQKLLFHKFQQAGKSLYTRDTTRGTGLGLYISRLLVEQMGGELKLDHTEEGKGTTFSFTLPLATAANTPIVKEPRLTVGSTV